ncbi:hypothetical protein JCM3766R1_004294 [Sporobolomyces carnicolor]
MRRHVYRKVRCSALNAFTFPTLSQHLSYHHMPTKHAVCPGCNFSWIRAQFHASLCPKKDASGNFVWDSDWKLYVRKGVARRKWIRFVERARNAQQTLEADAAQSRQHGRTQRLIAPKPAGTVSSDPIHAGPTTVTPRVRQSEVQPSGTTLADQTNHRNSREPADAPGGFVPSTGRDLRGDLPPSRSNHVGVHDPQQRHQTPPGTGTSLDCIDPALIALAPGQIGDGFNEWRNRHGSGSSSSLRKVNPSYRQAAIYPDVSRLSL